MSGETLKLDNLGKDGNLEKENLGNLGNLEKFLWFIQFLIGTSFSCLGNFQRLARSTEGGKGDHLGNGTKRSKGISFFYCLCNPWATELAF